MKSIARVLLIGAVAAMAITVSAAPSEAAKKAKTMAACTPMMACSTACKSGTCSVNHCGVDGKWRLSFAPVCWQPFCPSAC